MGKTTLMRTLMGALPTTGGHVEFEARDITRMQTHERSRLGMGLVPQGREIFPALSVQENLRMGLASAKTGDLKIIEEIIETLLVLKKRWSLSMIIVEQNLEFITSLSDRVLHIQKGRITGEVPREDLLAGRIGMAAA